jgi:signal peptidase I
MQASQIRARAARLWRKDIRPFLVLGLLIFSLRSSLADWNDVPSGSMRPTIFEGDRIFVNKLAYDLKVPFTTWHIAQWRNPQRGDVAVFYSPYDGARLVKRVVGLPGDTIELRRNRLFINGQAVEYRPISEELLASIPETERPRQIMALEDLPGQSHAVAAIPNRAAKRDFGPVVVPKDQYFMMGDNRDDSFDSRYYGTVGRDRIVGRATAVVLSFDRQHTWAPRWERFFRSLSS